MQRNAIHATLLVLLSSITFSVTCAFSIQTTLNPSTCSARSLVLPMSTSSNDIDSDNNKTNVKKAAAAYVEPGRNPNNPLLPELKGDYDWDEKFGSDEDWIVTNVPGKRVLSDAEVAAQVAALDALEQKWRKERQGIEFDKARLLGWTEQAETYNGRYAMFFLVVGLLTEYWTGFSMPAQVEEMLRIGGVIGFEG